MSSCILRHSSGCSALSAPQTGCLGARGSSRNSQNKAETSWPILMAWYKWSSHTTNQRMPVMPVIWQDGKPCCCPTAAGAVYISAVGKAGCRYSWAVWKCYMGLQIRNHTDYHSKSPEEAFTASVMCDGVITFLTSVFSHFGNPCSMADNGSQFTSVEFASFVQSGDVQHIRTSVYHPAANGAIECFDHVLKSCIRSTVLERKSWKLTTNSYRRITLLPIQLPASLLMNYWLGGSYALA